MANCWWEWKLRERNFWSLIWKSFLCITENICEELFSLNLLRCLRQAASRLYSILQKWPTLCVCVWERERWRERDQITEWERSGNWEMEKTEKSPPTLPPLGDFKCPGHLRIVWQIGANLLVSISLVMILHCTGTAGDLEVNNKTKHSLAKVFCTRGLDNLGEVQ